MKEENKKNGTVAVNLGVFDVITENMRRMCRKNKLSGKIYAIGVYTDEYIKEQYGRECLKPYEERKDIAGEFGDIIFPVNSKDINELKAVIEESIEEYLSMKYEKNKNKSKIGCVIGSFDLLHSGHIENIRLAKEMCEKLLVFVKSDERIQAKKNKTPVQSAQKRWNNLFELKSVDDVDYMEIEDTREDIVRRIVEAYKVEPSDIVMIFGSDLQEKEEEHKEEYEKLGVKIAFTDRPPEKMAKISSTKSQQKLRESKRSIKDLEEFEDENFL